MDQIKKRRILNQGCMDGAECGDMPCMGQETRVACCPANQEAWSWMTALGYIPCFVSSYNGPTEDVSPLDPMGGWYE